MSHNDLGYTSPFHHPISPPLIIRPPNTPSPPPSPSTTSPFTLPKTTLSPSSPSSPSPPTSPSHLHSGASPSSSVSSCSSPLFPSVDLDQTLSHLEGHFWKEGEGGDWEGGWEGGEGASDEENWGWIGAGGLGARDRGASPRGFLPFIYDTENFSVGGRGGGRGGGGGGEGEEIRKQRLLLKRQMKKAKKRESGVMKKRVGGKNRGGMRDMSAEGFSSSTSPFESPPSSPPSSLSRSPPSSPPNRSPYWGRKRDGERERERERDREERGGRKRMMSADLGVFPLSILGHKRKEREGRGGGGEQREGSSGGGVVGLLKSCGFGDAEDCERSFYHPNSGVSSLLCAENHLLTRSLIRSSLSLWNRTGTRIEKPPTFSTSSPQPPSCTLPSASRAPSYSSSCPAVPSGFRIQLPNSSSSPCPSSYLSNSSTSSLSSSPPTACTPPSSPTISQNNIEMNLEEENKGNNQENNEGNNNNKNNDGVTVQMGEKEKNDLCNAVLEANGRIFSLFLFCFWHELESTSSLSEIMREEKESVVVWRKICEGVSMENYSKIIEKFLKENSSAKLLPLITNTPQADASTSNRSPPSSQLSPIISFSTPIRTSFGSPTPSSPPNKPSHRSIAKVTKIFKALLNPSLVPDIICVCCYLCSDLTTQMAASRGSNFVTSGVTHFGQWVVSNLYFLRLVVPAITGLSFALAGGERRVVLFLAKVLMKVCSGSNLENSNYFTQEIIRTCAPIFQLLCEDVIARGSHLLFSGEWEGIKGKGGGEGIKGKGGGEGGEEGEGNLSGSGEGSSVTDGIIFNVSPPNSGGVCSSKEEEELGRKEEGGEEREGGECGKEGEEEGKELYNFIQKWDFFICDSLYILAEEVQRETKEQNERKQREREENKRAEEGETKRRTVGGDKEREGRKEEKDGERTRKRDARTKKSLSALKIGEMSVIPQFFEERKREKDKEEKREVGGWVDGDKGEDKGEREQFCSRGETGGEEGEEREGEEERGKLCERGEEVGEKEYRERLVGALKELQMSILQEKK